MASSITTMPVLQLINLRVGALQAMADVCKGSLAANRRNSLGVRFVPFSVSQAVALSVTFGENRRSKLIFQRRKSAHNGQFKSLGMRHFNPTACACMA